MIIHRYLISEIVKPLAAILGILAALFASYSAAGFLSDAVNGLLPIDILAEMIALKALISLEVLIPVSLFIAVVLAFGKLNGDSEFIAMFALQVTPGRVMRSVLMLSGGLAVLVAGLSLVARPWAYEALHELSRLAELTLDVDAMQAGTFYVGQNGSRVIFLMHRDGPASPARDVFVKRWHDGYAEIIHAKLGYQLAPAKSSGDPQILLSDAHIYELGTEERQTDRTMTASSIIVDPNRHDPAPPEYSSVAASSRDLAASAEPRDIAELQWRFSTPLSTLLLAMLGIPLSRVKPRQSKYEKFGTAILLYSGYYLICTSARTWVQHGVVPAFPGIWWAPGMLALVLLALTFAPGMGLRLRRRWA
ncbi:LPS export ABC transporter permease LptF [Aliidongia dinghuensis]|uniref:Lipopolysaccharide export system permease protein LptF n=1 Tax=Aliidongia dinghuensis TaxID=1867774 RepID=A0A8J3E7Q3_9PROT|nr:LPS export ABC transporter permease LptF [Aliidongia dinghuensis]GGF47372.1 LPS export ABC transporter permease LptF [Aliidongia dinghuensis]